MSLSACTSITEVAVEAAGAVAIILAATTIINGERELLVPEQRWLSSPCARATGRPI